MWRRLASCALATVVLTLGQAGYAAGEVSVRLEPFISGLVRPVLVTHAGDGSGRLFILEKDGRIRIFQKDAQGGGELRAASFLDIRNKTSKGGEQGLLGLAFHPQYAQNGRFFINYTNTGGDTIVAEYQRSAGDPNLADAAERVVLTVDQPESNHNGGMLAFGPDGRLYISLGDGGGGGDQHGAIGNGQNLETLLGKILRIDVDGAQPYAIPGDNPFAGATPGRDEIFAYGLRNPWRFSFDRGGARRLFAADVGQNSWEEVDIITAGGNYGWRVLEGNHCYNPPSGCDPTGKIAPIAEYPQGSGNCSVTGGYVYRGRRVPNLTGKYVFGDYCSGRIWSLEEAGGGAWTRAEIFDAAFQISSFGEDEDGEVYVCEYQNTDSATSRIHRFVDLNPPRAEARGAGWYR